MIEARSSRDRNTPALYAWMFAITANAHAPSATLNAAWRAALKMDLPALTRSNWMCVPNAIALMM